MRRRAAYEQALEQQTEKPILHVHFAVSDCFFAERCGGDGAAGSRSAGKPGIEDVLLATEADTAAYSGRLKDAERISRRAMDSAERAEEKETAATYAAVSALREALFGNADEARRRASLAMGRSAGRDVQYGAALALAYAGDDGRAQELTDDLGKRFPEDTIVQFNYLPTLRAKTCGQREILQRPSRV